MIFNNNKYVIFVRIPFLLVFFALFLNSCGENQKKNTGKKSIKIVSLAPSLTELVFFLGKGDCLVGCTTACNYPEQVSEIEKIGGFGKPSIEKLISLKPDAVIASALADKSVQKTIEQYGIKFYLLPSETMEDYPTALRLLGNILNCKKYAAKKIDEYKRDLENLSKENRAIGLRKKVYLEVWNNPYMTIGKKSFIDKMIYYAGGLNIASNIDKGYFNFSLEWLLKADPDVIICPAMSKDAVKDVENRDGWQNIKAIRNHCVHTGINNDLLYRLGPRTIQGIRLLKMMIEGKKFIETTQISNEK